MSDAKIKANAGTVAHDVKHSPHWTPFDPQYGDGGSAEYPLRTSVEARLPSPEKRMRLKNPEIRIEPTNRCNYECVMCPRDTHLRKQGVMPMEFYSSLMEEGISMGARQVTLTNFGEPFIDPTLEDKIHYATQRGLTSYIISNASLLHYPSRSEFAKNLLAEEDEPAAGAQMTKAEAAIRAGLTELRLSFYGTEPTSYERVMRGGKFEQVRANIHHFRKMREKAGRKGRSPTRKIETLLPEISIYFLDLPQNKGGIDAFLEFTKDLADYIEVWKPHNFGIGRENSYRGVDEGQELKSCGRPATGPIQINWQGIVVPCCYDYNQEIPLGNAALQTLEEILKGTPYEELRRCHASGDFASVPYCHRCDQLRKHDDALIVSTNPKHAGRSRESIMMSPNTRADFEMGE